MLLLCNSGPLMALFMICFTIVACAMFAALGKSRWF